MDLNLSDFLSVRAGLLGGRRATGRSMFTLGCALVIALIVVVPGASAQDETGDEPPEQAVMAPLAVRSLLLDSALAEDHLVVVGERGHILLSNDSGETWNQVPVPTRATLTGVWFESRELGWAVGHDSVILRTADGGQSWERMYWAPEDESPFLDVWFSDAETGFAVGAYGSLYETFDGGETWDFREVTDSDFQPHLNQITAGADGTVYIAAEAGISFKSEDGGETWTEMTSPYPGSFFGILPLDDGAILLFGLRGHLFRSEDGGETWSQLETDTIAMLNHAVQLPDGRVVIVGLSGTVLVSEDGGRSFRIREQPSRAGIQSVVRAGDDNLLFAGEFGVRKVPLSELFGK